MKTQVKEYLDALPEGHREAFLKLREVLKSSLPSGFEERMQYGMISYVVPKSIFPAGYHCKPEDPLVFISLGAQKKHIAIYHMAMYMMPELKAWFESEYPKHVKAKPDMGKSCIRFKNPKTIPFALIAELCQKVTVEEYLALYRSLLKK